MRSFNAGLRLGSLATKLIFTLFMGRYLGLHDMGTYGLITAYVTLLIPLLGLRLDYAVLRDIVDAPPLDLTRKMRDQFVFYGITYAVLVVVVMIGLLGPLHELNVKTALFALVLGILESLATITSSNLVSMQRPILANCLFFIRSSVWALPVMALDLLYPSLRNADLILAFWVAGVGTSLAITVYVWRNLPWAEVMRMPIDWNWVRINVTRCIPIWLGAVGLAASANTDRFVVEYYLGRDYVGVNTFYASFVFAVGALLQSGIFAFGSPQLVSLHRRGDAEGFRVALRKMTLHATLSAGIMSVIIGIVVPLLGFVFKRPEFAEHASTLWLMLLGAFIKSVTESLYYVMYARHQDRAIWIGNLMAFLPALACNALFIPVAGFSGIGYSAVVTAVFLCIWRVYCVRKFNDQSSWVAAS